MASKAVFKHAYKNSDTKALRKFVSKSPNISLGKFVGYIFEAYTTTKTDVCAVLLDILAAQYDSNKAIKTIIYLRDADFLEYVLLCKPKLKISPKLIRLTADIKSICMAKLLHEYFYGVNGDLAETLVEITESCDFDIDLAEHNHSVDHCIIALLEEEDNVVIDIIPHINPSIWNNFMITYACAHRMTEIVHALLSHPAVDPSINDNCLVRKAIDDQRDSIAVMLLKHPLVPIEFALNNELFVGRLVVTNKLSLVKKLYFYEREKLISIVKKYLAKILGIHHFNDVMYFLLDEGILNPKYFKLHRIDRTYTQNNYLFGPYVDLPYDLMKDPEEIFVSALFDNDLHLMSKLKDFSVSVNVYLFIESMSQYYIKSRNSDSELSEDDTILSYVWDKCFNDYNSTLFMGEFASMYYMLPNNFIDYVYDQIKLFGLIFDIDAVCKESNGPSDKGIKRLFEYLDRLSSDSGSSSSDSDSESSNAPAKTTPKKSTVKKSSKKKNRTSSSSSEEDTSKKKSSGKKILRNRTSKKK